MHRLFTAAALIVTVGLISESSDARPIEIRELHIKTTVGPNQASTDEGHRDWINLNKVAAIRWAPGIVSRNVRVRGRILLNAKGEPQHGALKVLKPIDKATPLLARAARTGRPLPRVVLILPTPRRGRGATLTITSSTISGNRASRNAGKPGKKTKVRPMEQISLNF